MLSLFNSCSSEYFFITKDWFDDEVEEEEVEEEKLSIDKADGGWLDFIHRQTWLLKYIDIININ
jgi:hypothetical protein